MLLRFLKTCFSFEKRVVILHITKHGNSYVSNLNVMS